MVPAVVIAPDGWVTDLETTLETWANAVCEAGVSVAVIVDGRCDAVVSKCRECAIFATEDDVMTCKLAVDLDIETCTAVVAAVAATAVCKLGVTFVADVAAVAPCIVWATLANTVGTVAAGKPWVALTNDVVGDVAWKDCVIIFLSEVHCKSGLENNYISLGSINPHSQD